MLTAAQVETVAYVTDDGIVCKDCAFITFENAGGEAVAEYRPLIQYEADEWLGELSEGSEIGPEGDFPDCTEDCAPIALTCEQCWQEIVEAYHYGHETEVE